MGVCKGAENNQNAHTRIRSFLLEKMSDMNVTHAKAGMLFVVSLYNSSMASARVRDNHRQTVQAPFALAPMPSRWFYVASLALPLSISTVSQSPPEALPMPMVIQERGRRRFRSSSLQQWFPGPSCTFSFTSASTSRTFPSAHCRQPASSDAGDAPSHRRSWTITLVAAPRQRAAGDAAEISSMWMAMRPSRFTGNLLRCLMR